MPGRKRRLPHLENQSDSKKQKDENCNNDKQPAIEPTSEIRPHPDITPGQPSEISTQRNTPIVNEITTQSYTSNVNIELSPQSSVPVANGAEKQDNHEPV